MSVGSEQQTVAGSRGDDTLEAETAELVRERPGTRIGRYAVLRRLGRGAMGVVYAAYDETLDRRIAIKVLRRRVRETDRTRVEREARAMAKVTHPHVVQVYEVGEDDGQLYIAMEFVQGETLARWQTGREWKDVLPVYRQAGEGLAAAHAVGLVHRDFKPDNVMVQASAGAAVAKVLDFGLVLHSEPAPSAEAPAPERATEGDPRLTAAGALMGTPAYMAPEQFESSNVGEAADQFSFCVALWEGLFGERPFAGESATELCHEVLEGRRRAPPRDTSVPRWLQQVVARGLSRVPGDRWPSMAELLQALTRDPDHARQRRASRVAVSIGGAVLLGAGALGLQAWWSARAQRCSGGEARLDGVWDDARSTEVHAAFAATSLPFAESTWEAVRDALDEHATRWVAMHRAACEATTVRGEQSSHLLDLRMACLDRAHVELQAAVDALATADAAVVENAGRVVGGLGDLDRCADVEALQADVEPPTEAEAEAVAQTRAWLARAAAERDAGRYAEARRHVERAEAALGETTYVPVRIELDLAKGSVLQLLADYDAARESFERALRLAMQSGSVGRMQAAATRLVHLTAGPLGLPAAAGAYRDMALELPASTLARAAAHEAAAELALVEGKYPDAEAHSRRALALREEVLEPDDREVATSRYNLANILEDRAAYAEAEVELRRALDSMVHALGPTHPAVARAHGALASIYSTQGKHAEAVAEQRYMLELTEPILGPDHPDVARARHNLGNALEKAGQPEEAERELRRALAALEKSYPDNHPDTATAGASLATLLATRGRLEEAEAQLRKALAQQERASGADHPMTAAVRINLATLLSQAGRDSESEAEYRLALPQLERTWGADHPHVARARNNFAGVLLALGRPDEAGAEARLALKGLEAVLGPDHGDVGRVYRTLAAAEDAQGHALEATAAARRAVEVMQAALPDDDRDLVAARDLLTRLEKAPR